MANRISTRGENNGSVATSELEKADNNIEGLGKKGEKAIEITAPNFQIAEIEIVGTAPYVQNKFSRKAQEMMRKTQTEGSKATKGKKRDPKDFDECFRQCQHKTDDGKCGIPAPAFRNAMIDACRLVGYKMTQGKMTVFIEADGIDCEDGTPLVMITKGKPRKIESPVRNDNGSADIRARALWDTGWTATVRIRYDADIFSAEDVMNLLHRAGQQVGVGEGRPFSRDSAGLGWGLFEPMRRKD